MKRYYGIFLIMIVGLMLSASNVKAAEVMSELSAPVSDLSLLENSGLSEEDEMKIPKEEKHIFTIFKNRKKVEKETTTNSDIQFDVITSQEDEISENSEDTEETTTRKFLKLNIPKVNLPFKKKTKEAKVPESNNISDVEVEADYLEYYPDKSEIEAIGNAKIFLPKDNMTLYASKITFNHDLNTVTAKENVRLITQDSETTGDFVSMNLSQDDGIIQNPITQNYDIKITAKEGKIFSDRIEEYNGVAKILKDYDVKFGARTFSSYVNKGRLDLHEGVLKPSESGVYHLKAKEIYINSLEEHNVITLKNTAVYAKKIKLGIVPKVQIISGKQTTVFESNIPEFGSAANLGAFFGPAIVLNMPKASTLKLAPLITYSDHKLGVGAFARFLSERNKTELYYGTSEDKFLISGHQDLTDRLSLRYSQNTYQDEWFMGLRRPRYSADLQYNRADFIDDLGLTFTQRYSVGYFVDDDDNITQGEMRMRWMTQAQKSFYRYQNKDKNIFIDAGLISQTAATVYSKGDVTGLFRFGPILTTNLGRWKQSIIYYQSATANESPFKFDRYAYGKSNLVLVEEFKICKWLTAGYLASLALMKDSSRNEDMWQENRIMLAIGPDYAKVTLGYDVIRQSTMLVLSMLVGAKDSEIEFKKATYKTAEKEKKGFFKKLVNL